mgnify:CR=1 FL=1
MKLITYEDIRRLDICSADCFAWVYEMIRDKKKAQLPPKISMKPTENILCNIMPCIIPDTVIGDIGGVKIINRYPERKPILDSKLFLLDMKTGDFLALMDANWITAMRTGAVAAHTIQCFAKKDFQTLAVLGLGNSARATLLILADLFPERTFRVKLFRYKGQEKLFEERFQGYPNYQFTYVDEYEELMKGSDVILSCATYFQEDICGDDCFDKGTLVVPVHTRGFTNCDLFFDKVFADDFGHVCHFKNFSKFKKFAEVSDVVNGNFPGRESDEERIIVYNIGLSIHDVNYAAHIYQLLKDDSSIAELAVKEPTDKFWV